MNLEKSTVERIAKAMGWIYVGLDDRGYHQVKLHDSVYAEPETVFFLDSDAHTIASKLGLVVDFRRGFVESRDGMIEQFTIGETDAFVHAVFTLAERLGSEMP